MSVETAAETMEFQTEARQILHLMTHSLYSTKEIFLRELISNASDACDKLRFEALGNDGLYEGDSDLGITINFDKEAKTVTVTDNGIASFPLKRVIRMNAFSREKAVNLQAASEAFKFAHSGRAAQIFYYIRINRRGHRHSFLLAPSLEPSGPASKRVRGGLLVLFDQTSHEQGCPTL